jgi:hypothetical protein
MTVAATRIKPDDPYRKVTKEDVSSFSLDHSHFRGTETGGKYRQGGPCAGRVLLVGDPTIKHHQRCMFLLFCLHNGY